MLKEVSKRLGSHTSGDKKFEEVLLNKMLVLIFSGNIDLSAIEFPFSVSVSDRPEATKLVRYQASYTDWVTNQFSNKISLDVFSRVMIQYLDGTNNVDDIVSKMKKHVLKKELTIKDKGEVITYEKVIEEKLKIFVSETLDKMVRCQRRRN